VEHRLDFYRYSRRRAAAVDTAGTSAPWWAVRTSDAAVVVAVDWASAVGAHSATEAAFVAAAAEAFVACLVQFERSAAP
jgi:hypothetical protein